MCNPDCQGIQTIELVLILEPIDPSSCIPEPVREQLQVTSSQAQILAFDSQ